jgi:hypothetical protein
MRCIVSPYRRIATNRTTDETVNHIRRSVESLFPRCCRQQRCFPLARCCPNRFRGWPALSFLLCPHLLLHASPTKNQTYPKRPRAPEESPISGASCAAGGGATVLPGDPAARATTRTRGASSSGTRSARSKTGCMTGSYSSRPGRVLAGSGETGILPVWETSSNARRSGAWDEFEPGFILGVGATAGVGDAIDVDSAGGCQP